MSAWPTRDEWARMRRTNTCAPDVSTAAADYFTPAEIEVEVQRLHELWKREPPGEDRRRIRRAKTALVTGRVPLTRSEGGDFCIFTARWWQTYHDAVKAADEAARHRPVDDAAWERELERRANIERIRNNHRSIGADANADAS